jgi:hypothetical protein
LVKKSKTIIRKPEPINKERITDDQGREIPFVRPNCDKLKSPYIKPIAKDSDDNKKLISKQMKILK